MARCTVLLVVCVGLVVAAPASARPHLAASFQLKGSHGYAIQVVAHRAPTLGLLAKSGRRVGKLTVVATKGNESTTSAEGGSASYTAPARFNKHRIRADLGPVGNVRLRFHKHRHFQLPPIRAPEDRRRIATCGQFGFFVPGRFRGVFRFHGEGGYTSARVHDVHGRLRRDEPVSCSGHEHGVALRARSGSIRFLAFQDNDFGVTSLSARTLEKSGGLKIVREASRLVLADAGEFSFNSGLTSARVAPGGDQFSGTADYASPSSWTGSLAVSFPGEEDVPLVGPGFDVTLDDAGLTP